MNDTDEPNDFDFGVWSNHWMAKMLVFYVPRSQLNLAVVKVIDALVYGDGDEDLLDILAQTMATGRYVQTREHTEDDHFPAYTTQSQDETLPEEEIERQVREVVAFLNDLGPTAADPLEDFDINNWTNGKEEK
jgi:hypothetical protein